MEEQIAPHQKEIEKYKYDFEMNKNELMKQMMETKEQRKEREKRRALDEQRKREEIKKYGHPTKIINSAGRGTYSPLVRVFGKTEFIEINGRKYYYCETTTDGFLIGEINEGINVDKFETRIEWTHTEDEED